MKALISVPSAPQLRGMLESSPVVSDKGIFIPRSFASSSLKFSLAAHRTINSVNRQRIETVLYEIKLSVNEWSRSKINRNSSTSFLKSEISLASKPSKRTYLSIPPENLAELG